MEEKNQTKKKEEKEDNKEKGEKEERGEKKKKEEKGGFAYGKNEEEKKEGQFLVLVIDGI